MAVITFIAASEASGGLLGALGINGKLFVIQLLAFLIFIGLLAKFVLPTLIKAIDGRRAAIEAGLAEAKQSRDALEAATAKVDDVLASARGDADAVMQRAQEEAATVVAEAEVKARERAERLVADARKQLETDIAAARRDLKKDTAALVALATERIIDERLDATKDAQLIDRSLQEAAK